VARKGDSVKYIVILAVLVLTYGISVAVGDRGQIPNPTSNAISFEYLDVNRDSLLSRVEVIGLSETGFEQADYNNDSVLDETEYLRYLAGTGNW
jgi:bacteriorhodopsin